MRSIFYFMLVAGVVGCSTTPTKYADMGDYRIAQSGPFLLSFSPELWKFLNSNRPEPSKDVRFFISNNDNKPHSIFLDKTVVDANGNKESVACRSPESKGEVKLVPGKAVQVICEVDLKPNGKNKLGLKDTYVIFQIANDTAKSVEFQRLYRIEDFQ